MSAVATGRHLLGTLAAAWGIVGVVSLLSYAILRLGTFALELTNLELSLPHWVLLTGSVLFMAYSEGYRGFQRAFAPRTVARARHLLNNPSTVQVVLAPLFCMGYFHATRRRLITSYTLTVMIVGFVLVARSLDQPWRGIIDAGVVVGLAWGVVSILALAWQGFSDPHFDVSPELPVRAESHDSGQEMDRTLESNGAEPGEESRGTRLGCRTADAVPSVRRD